MMDREKVIKGLECCQIGAIGCQTDCPYSLEDSCKIKLHRDAIALLNEQQEQIDRLLEENASNAEMTEGLKELLKEQGKKYNQLAEWAEGHIVFCKDCKHWDVYDDCPTVGYCDELELNKRDCWFCADGVRRE